MSTGASRRLSNRGKRYALATVIAAQFAAPAIALAGTPPTRFGFQMYSAQGWTEISAVDAQGTQLDIQITEHVAGILRPEFDWTQSDLAERVCATTPRAYEVTVAQPEQARTLRC